MFAPFQVNGEIIVYGAQVFPRRQHNGLPLPNASIARQSLGQIASPSIDHYKCCLDNTEQVKEALDS